MTARVSPPRTVVCVSGMHRAASFAARVIELLGVSLGDAPGLMGPGPDNAAGYFENRAVTELDDVLLAELGGSWDRPPVLRPGWEHDPALDHFREQASAIVRDTFGPAGTSPGTIGFKDPRLSLLLPFWRTVLPIRATIVLVRDPHEVIASLGRRKFRVDPTQSAVLWVRYLLAATRHDPDHLLVRQADFFDDLPATLDRIARHVGVATPAADQLAAIQAHFDPALHHTAERDAPAWADDPLVAIAELVWNGGDPDPDLLLPAVATALAEGCCRARPAARRWRRRGPRPRRSRSS
jgi:hypothetical protein